MSSSPPADAENTKREQPRRRMGRLSGAIMAAFFGLIAFSSVAGNPRFETIHTLDVIRLMTAGAGFGVALVLIIWCFNSRGPTSRV